MFCYVLGIIYFLHYLCLIKQELHMEFDIKGFPSQQLSFTRKNRKWRKQNVDFADSRSLLHYRLTRKSVYNM